MYNLSSDTDILDKGIVTYPISDIINAAELAIKDAEESDIETSRILNRGRAEVYLTLVPLVLPDHLWYRYRAVLSRVLEFDVRTI